MIMWIIIFSLLVIGLALIVIELIFIPGTTVVGLLGLIFAGAGVVIGYQYFGSDTGLYILIGALLATLGALFYSFRSGAWSRFSNKSSSDGKVNEGITHGLSIGDEGITLSTLRPIGKAEFHNKTFEVKTLGQYMETGQHIRIIQIRLNDIVVEPFNQP